MRGMGRVSRQPIINARDLLDMLCCEEGREGGEDGSGCYEGVAEGAAVDVEEGVGGGEEGGGRGGEEVVQVEGVEGGGGGVGDGECGGVEGVGHLFDWVGWGEGVRIRGGGDLVLFSSRYRKCLFMLGACMQRSNVYRSPFLYATSRLHIKCL